MQELPIHAHLKTGDFNGSMHRKKKHFEDLILLQYRQVWKEKWAKLAAKTRPNNHEHKKGQFMPGLPGPLAFLYKSPTPINATASG